LTLLKQNTLLCALAVLHLQVLRVTPAYYSEVMGDNFTAESRNSNLSVKL